MNEAAKTLDGWYSLHLFYAIDWASLKTVPEEDRNTMISEFKTFLEALETVHNSKEGSHAFYNITGQKADLMLWFLRPDVKQLNALENEFNKLDISDFLIPTYSYVSIVELSNYLAVTLTKIHTKTHMLKQDYIQKYHVQSTYVSTQWIKDVTAKTTGIC